MTPAAELSKARARHAAAGRAFDKHLSQHRLLKATLQAKVERRTSVMALIVNAGKVAAPPGPEVFAAVEKSTTALAAFVARVAKHSEQLAVLRAERDLAAGALLSLEQAHGICAANADAAREADEVQRRAETQRRIEQEKQAIAERKADRAERKALEANRKSEEAERKKERKADEAKWAAASERFDQELLAYFAAKGTT